MDSSRYKLDVVKSLKLIRKSKDIKRKSITRMHINNKEKLLKYSGNQRNLTSGAGPLLDENGRIVINVAKKEGVLNRYFCSLCGKK